MNGEKIMKDEHEFDSWRTSAGHYGHGSGGMGGSGSSGSDPYAMSYYPTPAVFPYSESMPSSQPWSNGAETMTFLGGFPEQHSGGHSGHSSGHYAMEAMFGNQNYGFSNAMTSPFNAFFPSNSDPFWGSTNKTSRGPAPYRMHESEYNYVTDNYADQSIKGMESGIAGLTLDHIKASEQFAKSSFAEAKKFDGIGSAVGQSVPKKMTWASIASQPAKPQPKSLKSKMSSSALTGQTSKHLPPTSMEAIGTWESKNGSAAIKTPPVVTVPPPPLPRPLPTNQTSWTPQTPRGQQPPPVRVQTETMPPPLPAHPVLDKLRVENNYNPKEFDLINARNARFFIIKSYSEDDIHRSIKYSIWCSTEHGNKRLDNAFKQQETKGPIYLLFSVNGSGHFCGMAQMVSYVDYQSSSSVWAQDKWKGQFRVKWIYVKDVPNAQLRHIRLENNENKPVTNSRDTQEVPYEKGKQVIKIMHHFRHSTSIFDDFLHYEKRQEEECQRRTDPAPPPQQQQPPLPPSGQQRAKAWKSSS